jgi:CRP-like cAMP-binding protein
MNGRPLFTETPRTFRKGDVLFHAGDPTTHVFLIQTGLVALMHPAGDAWIEVAKVTAPQIVGEEALWGAEIHDSTATAVNDTRAIAIPVQQARAFFEHLPPPLKLVFKGVLQKQNGLVSELKSLRLENDPTPCPAGAVTRLFAAIHTAATYSGTRKGQGPDAETQVVWQSFKKYTQRTFLESPVRLEQAVYILVNLGLARLEMVKSETDPEAPEELGFVYFRRLEEVREFYEFYRRSHTSGDLALALEDPALPPGRAERFRDFLAELEEWNRTGKVTLPTSTEGTPQAA